MIVPQIDFVDISDMIASLNTPPARVSPDLLFRDAIGVVPSRLMRNHQVSVGVRARGQPWKHITPSHAQEKYRAG